MNSVSPSSRSSRSGPNAKVVVLGDEQPELVGQVEIGLVVGRGGKQDAFAFVLLDVFVDGAIALALAIAEVVAFVDQDEGDSGGVRAVRVMASADRDDLGHAGGIAAR